MSSAHLRHLVCSRQKWEKLQGVSSFFWNLTQFQSWIAPSGAATAAEAKKHLQVYFCLKEKYPLQLPLQTLNTLFTLPTCTQRSVTLLTAPSLAFSLLQLLAHWTWDHSAYHRLLGIFFFFPLLQIKVHGIQHFVCRGHTHSKKEELSLFVGNTMLNNIKVN